MGLIHLLFGALFFCETLGSNIFWVQDCSKLLDPKWMCFLYIILVLDVISLLLFGLYLILTPIIFNKLKEKILKENNRKYSNQCLLMKKNQMNNRNTRTNSAEIIHSELEINSDDIHRPYTERSTIEAVGGTSLLEDANLDNQAAQCLAVDSSTQTTDTSECLSCQIRRMWWGLNLLCFVCEAFYVITIITLSLIITLLSNRAIKIMGFDEAVDCDNNAYHPGWC